MSKATDDKKKLQKSKYKAMPDHFWTYHFALLKLYERSGYITGAQSFEIDRAYFRINDGNGRDELIDQAFQLELEVGVWHKREKGRSLPFAKEMLIKSSLGENRIYYWDGSYRFHKSDRSIGIDTIDRVTEFKILK